MIQIKINSKKIIIFTSMVAILLGLFLVSAANLPSITISSPANNTYYNSSDFEVNFTLTDAPNGTYKVELILAGTYLGNNSYSNETLQTFVANDTFPDGTYTWELNVSNVTDVNTTGLYTVIVDRTTPSLSYGDTTSSDNKFSAENNITVNISITETNPANLTFNLYNSTSLYNSTFKSQKNVLSNVTINWTDLPDDTYKYNVTVLDDAMNQKTSVTRTYTVDTTVPVTQYAATTPANNSNVSLIWIDASLTESNPATINFTLTNSTDQYNLTSKNMADSTSNTTIIWSSLAEGTYTFNYTIRDMVGFVNTSITRTVTVDTTVPTLNVEGPVNLTEDTDGSVTFTYTTTDANTLANCSLYLEATINSTNSSLTYNDTNSSFVIPGITASDDLEWYITCSDAAGNMNTSSVYTMDTLADEAATSTTTTPTTAGGSTSDDAEETEEEEEEVDEVQEVIAEALEEDGSASLDELSAWLESGEVSLELNLGEVIELTYLETLFEFEILQYGENTVTVKIDGQEVTIEIGTTSDIDLDQDGTIDLQVTLNGVNEEGTADFTIMQAGENWTLEETSSAWAWWVVGILAVLIIAGLVLYWIKSK